MEVLIGVSWNCLRHRCVGLLSASEEQGMLAHGVLYASATLIHLVCATYTLCQ